MALWHDDCDIHRVAINARTMKTAIPLYRSRIAPLFDVAESFQLVNPMQHDDSEILLFTPKVCVAEKCLRLHEHGVNVLLCGAASRVCLKHLTGLGIEVHAFLTGDAHEVLQTFLHDGSAGLARYAMPGCGHGACRQRRHRRRRLFCDFDSLLKE
jgi:predicted Fe-Mo cluster-binding NifX family protein